MGLRDRLEGQAARIAEQARAAAASDRVQRAGESFRGFRGMLSDDGKPLSIEGYLLALVRAVRDDERGEEETKRDLYVRARKRRRRLGLMSFMVGPLAGAASRLADLYCEAATVCDVGDLHRLELSDETIAAHMLVMWSVVDDFDRAEGAMRAEPPILKILEGRLVERSDLTLPEELTKLSIAKLLWEVHQEAGDALVGAKKAASGQPIRSVAFTGHRVKKVIRKAEAQLGVSR